MKTTRLLLLILLLFAFALRVVGIEQVPPGLSGDESMNGADAVNMWGWDHLPVFFTTNFGREAFFFYLMAICVKLWGASPFTIRLPAILCGMSGIVLAYILVKRLWGERVALLTVALLSVSFWPIFTSRVGLRAVSMVPWSALCLYALWRGLHERRWRWWIVTGVSLGVLTYTYLPGRFFAVVPIAWLMTRAVLGDRHPWAGAKRHQVWLGLLLAAGIALLIFWPFGRFIVQYPELANQRIRELDSTLQHLRAGNPRPLWQSMVKTAGMFTVRGEGDWYYNVSQRPLFDQITGLWFYAGVLLSLWRWRDPRYQLLLLWASAMLAPTVLAFGTPSFLRVIGAQIPIYLLPALAFDALWRRLEVVAESPRLSWGMAGIAALGLALIAWQDGQAYFVQWAQEPRAREIYAAGLAQVGAALDAQLPVPDDTRVLVSCDYAADLCRDAVRFQTRYTGPIQWFVGRSALVFPQAVSASGDALYFFGDALPPPDILQPWAQSAAPLTLVHATNGALESAHTRVPAAQRAQLPWTPQTPLEGRFQRAITLLGYDLPAQVERGQGVTLIIYWRVPEATDLIRDAPLWFTLTSRDEDGTIWDQRANLLPLAPWDWQPGDVVAQMIGFPLPAYTPPVTLHLEFGLERYQKPLPYHAATGDVAEAARLGSLLATGAPVVTPPANVTRMGLDNEVALGERLMVGHAAPGELFSTMLYWYTLKAPLRDYAVRFQWRVDDCGGPIAHTMHEALLPATHPTSRWQPGEPLRSTHVPLIPRDMPDGTYYVTLDLVPVEEPDITLPADPEACQPVVISGRARQFTPPDIAYPHEQPLSDGVRLLGYDLAPSGAMRPGEALEVTLYWQADTAPSQGYTVFVHLYRPDGQLAGQHDGPPCAGGCPTFSWIEGEVLQDRHTLTIDPAATSGDYRLGVGMYDPGTLARLHVPQMADDVIILTEIALQE